MKLTHFYTMCVKKMFPFFYSPATGGVKEVDDDGAAGGTSRLPPLFPSRLLDCVATRYSSSTHRLRMNAQKIVPERK